MDIQETGWIGAARTGLIWLRIETGGGAIEGPLASQKDSDT